MKIFKFTIILSLSVYLFGFIGSIPDPFASPIWPATGFQIAMYFRYGNRALFAMTPGIAIIMFQSGYIGGLGLWPSVAFALVGVTAMISEAILTRYFTKPSKNFLNDEKSFLRFTFLGAPIGALSSSLQGVSLLSFFNAYPSTIDNYIPYVVWLSGNIIGAYVLVPLLTIKKEDITIIKEYYKQIIGYSFVIMLLIYIYTYNIFLDKMSTAFIVLLIVPIYFLIKLQKYAVIVTVLSSTTILFIILHLNNRIVKSEDFSLYNMLNTQLYISVILAASMIFFNQLKRNTHLSEKLKYQNETLNDLVSIRTAELENINKKLVESANTDSLTNIYNRRYFYAVASDIIKISKRDDTVLCFAMIDIDNFKQVNDTYGHDIGDKVIVSTVTLIKEQIRRSDIFARFGGEEFIILFPNTNLERALIILEKIRFSIEDNPIVNNIKSTVSIGLSEFNNKSDDINNAIKRADIALYKSKKSGKNIIST